MSADVSGSPSTERLMTFEVSGALFALPIAGILEVLEQKGMSCVPTLPREKGGVINWHGEALPVVAPHLLLGGAPMAIRGPDEVSQFLVVTDRPDAPAMLGLPIDGVTGLIDGSPGRVRGDEVVVERRPLEDRVVSVINPQRLVAQAALIIQSAVA
ncbi:MAG: chemotaxis signal transduction protein [Myxococcota bacterium]|jgi:chemotaxis signal transduction protein